MPSFLAGPGHLTERYWQYKLQWQMGILTEAEFSARLSAHTHPRRQLQRWIRFLQFDQRLQAELRGAGG